MYKNKIVNILVILMILIGLTNFSYATELNENIVGDDRFHKPQALSIPEKDINLKIENITMGCETYLLIPVDLFYYNMEKFVENNLENEYYIQNKKAERIKHFYDNRDYLGYIDFLKEEGFDVEENELELRHYCLCINDTTEILGFQTYNKISYVKLKINLKDNQFKLIMKDYLVDYDCSNIVFLIDEYGTETYIPVSEYNFVQNAEQTNLNECNITYTYYTNEDYEQINKAISIGYTILYVLIFLIVLFILIHELKKRKKQKLEIEKRLFWKEKSPKIQKALENERIKEEIREIKQKKKKSRKK